METNHIEFPVTVFDRTFTVLVSKHPMFGKSRPWCAHASVDGIPVVGRGATFEKAMEAWQNKVMMKLGF